MIFSYIDDEPVVSLEIINSSKDFIPFHGYLDSGAGVSVFHIDVAEILGVNIYKGTKFFLTVGDGAKIESYAHKLWVRFAKKEFVADLSFSPSLGIGTNIIGLKSFFDNFYICFNNKKHQVEIDSF